MTRYVSTALICIFLASTAQAQGESLTQTELRRTVSEQNALPPRQIVASIEAETGSEVIDLQAFLVQNCLTYKILLRNEAGELRTISVSGRTGAIR